MISLSFLNLVDDIVSSGLRVRPCRSRGAPGCLVTIPVTRSVAAPPPPSSAFPLSSLVAVHWENKSSKRCRIPAVREINEPYRGGQCRNEPLPTHHCCILLSPPSWSFLRQRNRDPPLGTGPLRGSSSKRAQTDCSNNMMGGEELRLKASSSEKREDVRTRSEAGRHRPCSDKLRCRETGI